MSKIKFNQSKCDSDYEMEDENAPQEKTTTNKRQRIKAKQPKENKKAYGKINLMKYFIFEVKK